MSNDCQWVESRLEDFLADSAPPEVRIRIESHLDTCTACRQEVEGYRKVDNLVRSHFEHQLARAESGTNLSFRPLRVAGAFAGTGGLVLAVWLGMGVSEPMPAPSLEEAGISPTGVEDPLLKAEEEADILRAKPTEEEAVPGLDLLTPARETVARPAAEAMRSFYVTDAAGYTRTLADYSGSILVLGVFGDGGQDAFENAYASYGTDTRFSFVGVTSTTDQRAEGITFPLLVNRGSSLLETPASGFTIVAPDGEIYRRGSLQNNSLIGVLATSLEELSDSFQ